MKTIKLNNGVEMPQIGLGTFLIPKDKLSYAIKEAYDSGYRQFDTAWRYHNEKEIGLALKEHGIKREDVFITTKVNADALYFKDYKYGRHRIFNIRNLKSVRQVIQESFDNLGTDYIDLFLVHWPWPMMGKMYSELERLYKQGRIRAIGVSNFLQPHIEYLSEISEIVPAVNQIEISPLNSQKPLISFCEKRGIRVEAMSTFSHYRSVKPRKEILENDLLMTIAKNHNKTVVQVVLRWMLQQNIIMIPKTWLQKHLKENISIFDFELSLQEMNAIDGLDKGKCLNYIPYGEQRWLPKRYRNWDGFIKWNKENPQRSVWQIIMSKIR